MLPYYIGEYELKEKNYDFESARQILMNGDGYLVVKRRFGRINNMITCKS